MQGIVLFIGNKPNDLFILRVTEAELFHPILLIDLICVKNCFKIGCMYYDGRNSAEFQAFHKVLEPLMITNSKLTIYHKSQVKNENESFRNNRFKLKVIKLSVGGLGLVIAGAVLQFKYTGLLDILGDERLATPILLLAAGALCSLLGFLGCCGAIRENYCLTVSFAVLLTLVLTIETAIAIAAYALQEPLQASLSQQLTLGLQRYNRSAGVRMAWDQTQKQFACCGVHNFTDWNTPPDSCCIKVLPDCRLIHQNLQPSGCMERLEHWLILNAAMVGGFSAIVGSLQVIGICFACCLSKSILKDFHDSYY
ncbi:unnamed protein product [Brugia pahangi]|uniref:Tetraspanin n=1 Tax=Brugia pahangi TaxID=6280 RepID=A0A0N4T3J5_BRUPA|nr:unnamed protein product [Brugia pahangi]